MFDHPVTFKRLLELDDTALGEMCLVLAHSAIAVSPKVQTEERYVHDVGALMIELHLGMFKFVPAGKSDGVVIGYLQPTDVCPTPEQIGTAAAELCTYERLVKMVRIMVRYAYKKHFGTGGLIN